MCRVFTEAGEREAFWVRSTRMFVFTDQAAPQFILAKHVDEWAPASVKY
jgi:hypothetical protein